MIPRLIHPVDCVLHLSNRAVSKFDPLAREPVRTLWRAGDAPGTGSAVTISAQVNWNDGSIAKPTFKSPEGVDLHYSGYLLARVVDLVVQGLAVENSDGSVTFGIVRGDRIVRIGRRRVNLFVLWFRDVAFYPDQGGGTLFEILFEDRTPSDPI